MRSAQSTWRLPFEESKEQARASCQYTRLVPGHIILPLWVPLPSLSCRLSTSTPDSRSYLSVPLSLPRTHTKALHHSFASSCTTVISSSYFKVLLQLELYIMRFLKRGLRSTYHLPSTCYLACLTFLLVPYDFHGSDTPTLLSH